MLLTNRITTKFNSIRNYATLGRSILQKKTVSGLEERSTPQEILISFHSSGLTANQWRKLKNAWFPGRTLFRPSRSSANAGNKKEKTFFEQLARSAGPTCVLHLSEEASDGGSSSRLAEFLPSSTSERDDLLLLYGQYRSTLSLADHMDVEKATSLDDGLETTPFQFYLPVSYLSFLCSREEFDLGTTQPE